jgi:hypothetical protein
VITTPDLPPATRRRFEMRRFATDGPSRSATLVTIVE